MEALRISGLVKRFGEKRVLNGLNLTIPRNSIFGFIGKNGAGKTTCMKIILGLEKADAGDVFVNGERVEYGKTAVNRRIGYLPDAPEFYPFMTAREYLFFCGEISGLPGEECRARAQELLRLVGLQDEAHRIKGYSRGMKQRLGIAQALLSRPEILILDEPASALDPAGRRELLEILSEIRHRTTVMFSTHILSDVERICTDVAVLNGGEARVQGALSDIRRQYREAPAYIFETETEAQCRMLESAFSGMKRAQGSRLIFREGDRQVREVLGFIYEKSIPLVRMERAEPSLEEMLL